MSAMLPSRPQKNYPGSQPDLYAILLIGWTSYQQHLPQFSNFNSRYDAALATGQLAALDAAMAMPDEYAREEVHTTLRLQLVTLSENCLKRWGDMSSYIRYGFPKEEYDNKRLAAGHAYYAPALANDWEQVLTLMASGQQFLDANMAQLTAGGMPANYPTDFATARAQYIAGYNAYEQALEDSITLTDQRMEANNALYEALTAMFADAKLIFRDQPAIRLQFNFEHIHNTINNGGNTPGTTAIVAGTITDMMTLMPIGNARVAVMFNGQELVTFTDINGKYDIMVAGVNGLTPAGMNVSHPMYNPASRPITLDPTKKQEEDFQLTTITPPPPPMP